MNEYIVQAMAQNGYGIGDAREIAKICAKLPHMAWDILDAMYNFGQTIKLTPEGEKMRDMLRETYSNDDIECFSVYVNAFRNVNSAYPA